MVKKLLVSGLLVLVALLLIGCCWYCYPEKPKYQAVYVPVVVHRGDTLDGIIYTLANEYGDNRDIREIRYYARKQNNIEPNSFLFPGDKLVIELLVDRGEQLLDAKCKYTREL